MPLTLVSVNCGVPRIIGERNGGSVLSAIGKSPVGAETIFFGSLGFEGDVQANRSMHGGADKAVCVYSADHWAWWRDEKGFRCEAGTFGENLTVLGADEESVGIGDRFAWGDVILEVTQPRGPCANVDLHHGRSDLAQTMTLSIRCGWYMRVIGEGSATTRKAFIRHTTATGSPRVRETFAARYDLHAPLALKQRVCDCATLAAGWRRAVARTLS